MTYRTIVIDYTLKAKKMAAAIEEKANELAQAGWELRLSNQMVPFSQFWHAPLQVYIAVLYVRQWSVSRFDLFPS